jgi:hypothetical protein
MSSTCELKSIFSRTADASLKEILLMVYGKTFSNQDFSDWGFLNNRRAVNLSGKKFLCSSSGKPGYKDRMTSSRAAYRQGQEEANGIRH